MKPEAGGVDATATQHAHLFSLRLLGLFYLLGSLLVLFFPSELLYVINIGPAVFKLAEPLPAPVDRLWLILASSWLFLHAILSFSKTALWIQAASLAFAGAALLAAFFTDHAYFGYLLFGSLNSVLAILLSLRVIRSPQ